jgi:predicted alpha/beta superfamily hydrolase
MFRAFASIVGTCAWSAAVLAGGRFLPPEQFASAALGTNRTIRIWLPPSYDSSADARFPVLYLHDGQNVLSTAGPHVAFGWGSWDVDLTVERLVAERRMREIILVAVDNTRDRYAEYRGRAAAVTPADNVHPNSPGADPGGNAAYERYARFLVEELKPAVDRRFRTLADPAHTGVLGSSMGGICSLALAWDHPDVFGLAASMSGAYQVENRGFLEGVLKTCRGSPKTLRLYFDCGAKSGNAGDDGRADTEAVVAELRRIGWRDGANLCYFLDTPPLTAEQLAPFKLPADKLKEAQTSQHNELYWRLRVGRPLEFLFPSE